jgi:hypothetical protein
MPTLALTARFMGYDRWPRRVCLDMANGSEVLRGFEPRSLDSESMVQPVTP